MKSFDKFQHERTDLHELKIGERMSSVGANLKSRNNLTQRTTGITADTYRKNPGLKRQRIEQEKQAANNPKPKTVNSQRRVSDTAPANPNAGSSIVKSPTATKGSNIPKRTNTGIKSVMDRTKTKLQKSANTETGRKVGRALQGAGKEILDYKPDRERTDTGAGGMGTALRQMTGIGQAAVQGALKAPSERINPKQKKTLGGKLGLKAKERFQTAIGVKPTSRTEFGGKVTGDTSKQAAAERLKRLSRGVRRSVDTTGLSRPERQKKEAEAVTKTGNRITGDTKLRDMGGRKIKKIAAPNLGNRLTGEKEKPQRVIRKNIPTNTSKPPADINKQLNEPQKKQPRSRGKKILNTLLSNPENYKNQTTKKPETTTKTPKRLEAAPINPEVVGRETTSVSKPQTSKQGETIDVKATPVNDAVSGSKKPNQISGSKTAGSLPPGSSRRIAGQRRVKRRNIASSEFKDKDGNFDYKAYKAAGNRVGTKKGGGRPVMRQSGQFDLFTGKLDKPKLVNQKTGRELNKNKENKALKKNDPKKPKETFKQNELKLESKKMNFTKILEANRIAAEREIKNQHGSVTGAQMRTYDQMKKDKASADLKTKVRTGSVMVTNSESYSHWREEFIWETDKKFPDKMKEIKPMSGKNNITINPEDETSKYKRGY